MSRRRHFKKSNNRKNKSKSMFMTQIGELSKIAQTLYNISTNKEDFLTKTHVAKAASYLYFLFLEIIKRASNQNAPKNENEIKKYNKLKEIYGHLITEDRNALAHDFTGEHLKKHTDFFSIQTNLHRFLERIGSDINYFKDNFEDNMKKTKDKLKNQSFTPVPSKSHANRNIKERSIFDCVYALKDIITSIENNTNNISPCNKDYGDRSLYLFALCFDLMRLVELIQSKEGPISEFVRRNKIHEKINEKLINDLLDFRNKTLAHPKSMDFIKNKRKSIIDKCKKISSNFIPKIVENEQKAIEAELYECRINKAEYDDIYPKEELDTSLEMNIEEPSKKTDEDKKDTKDDFPEKLKKTMIDVTFNKRRKYKEEDFKDLLGAGKFDEKKHGKQIIKVLNSPIKINPAISITLFQSFFIYTEESELTKILDLFVKHQILNIKMIATNNEVFCHALQILIKRKWSSPENFKKCYEILSKIDEKIDEVKLNGSHFIFQLIPLQPFEIIEYILLDRIGDRVTDLYYERGPKLKAINIIEYLVCQIWVHKDIPKILEIPIKKGVSYDNTFNDSPKETIIHHLCSLCLHEDLANKAKDQSYSYVNISNSIVVDLVSIKSLDYSVILDRKYQLLNWFFKDLFSLLNLQYKENCRYNLWASKSSDQCDPVNFLASSIMFYIVCIENFNSLKEKIISHVTKTLTLLSDHGADLSKIQENLNTFSNERKDLSKEGRKELLRIRQTIKNVISETEKKSHKPNNKPSSLFQPSPSENSQKDAEKPFLGYEKK